MTKTEPLAIPEPPALPGSLTLPGRTLTDPAALPPALTTRALTAAEFQGLADVPPELEWFANITNAKTRRAYQQDLKDFTAFVGISCPEEFRIVTRPHVIAWRKDLERRNLALATIRITGQIRSKTIGKVLYAKLFRAYGR